MAAIRDSPPAIPANASCRSRTATSPKMLLGHGYSTHGRQVALTPSNHETAAGPYDRWPLARLRAPASSVVTHEPVVSGAGVRQPGRASGDAGRGLSPHRGPGRQVMQFIADAKQIDPDKPFYLLCFGAAHAPIMWPRNGRTSTRGSSTAAGTPTGTRCSPLRRLGIVPDTSSPGTTPTSRSGTRYPSRHASCSAA